MAVSPPSDAMLTILALHLCMQVTPPSQQTAVRDSTPADSIKRDKARRLPVTAAVLASAFHDATARELFQRARRARIAQDSSLRSYDATVKQRFSVLMSVGKIGRERLVYRTESAARVQWQRDVGARVEVTGARVAIPLVGSSKVDRDALQSSVLTNEMSPIPYFPGSETLWIGGTSRTEVDERQLVNPLAQGAEAYYTYRSADSVSFRLPDGRTIQLRELEVRPRFPKWNVTVGSLWFDTESGQLVRAAYRLAAPSRAAVSVQTDDSTAKAPKLISFVMNALLSPNSANVSAVVVEYGLYEGRYWLPRLQSLEGYADALFAHVPVKYENAFTYTTVNGTAELAKFTVDTTVTDHSPDLPRRPPAGLDSAARRKWRDSTRAVYDTARKARDDSVKAGMRVGTMRQCDTSATRVVTEYRYGDARLPVLVRAPCDLDKLIQSPDLPASIYGPGEEIFGSADREHLIGEALTIAAQAPLFSLLPKPNFQFGPSLTRYNRVEGFSTGLRVDQQLGGGYTASATARFGAADHVGNAELSVARTNGSKTIRLGGYKRLVSANDWGDPLTFRSSLSAFLFGQDEGFYYRATGGEVLWSSQRGVRLDWRAFAEWQRDAVKKTSYSVAGNFGPNVDAAAGMWSGLGVRFLHTHGLDPRGFRVFTDLRLEGARSDSTYGRGALDLTLSRELVGKLDGALTLAGGTSIGQLPPQRRWFLGGTPTVRGQSPDTAQSGNAFWLGRAELARAQTGFRLALFGDLGWTGDRAKVGDVVRPMSGVGVGISGFDGLIRLDVARGLYPRKQTRLGFYLDARF